MMRDVNVAADTERLIDLETYPVYPVLSRLLSDKTTGKNIIWATDNYQSLGSCYAPRSEMTVSALMGIGSVDIQPRCYKSQLMQKKRTKAKAEVFTPSWICCYMNNKCDDIWFGKENVFNTMDGQTWTAKGGRIGFAGLGEDKQWTDYVRSRRIEITCGEAPYIASRYDTTTGQIIPVSKRIGILDRKLRVVAERTTTEDEWFFWVKKSYEATYGYEWQGDNLLIARVNLLLTFCDYLDAKWHRKATLTELRTIANIIAWNLWQMDGLTFTVPLGGPVTDAEQQMTETDNEACCVQPIYCLVRKPNGTHPMSIRFKDIVDDKK